MTTNTTDFNLKRLKGLIIEILVISIFISGSYQLFSTNSGTIEPHDSFNSKKIIPNSNKSLDSSILPNRDLSLFNSTSFVDYTFQNNQNMSVKSKTPINLYSSTETQLIIESSIDNVNYELKSSSTIESEDWVKSTVSDDGDINVSRITRENETYYRLNFTDNGAAAVYGKSNRQFNVSSLPQIYNRSTFISFSYRIPSLSQELNSSVYRLELEFKFINHSIIFVLAESGWNYGTEIEENIINGTNAIYILCGKNFPYNWTYISYNITRLINLYFSKEDPLYFSEIQTVYCNMFSIYSGYTLLLDFETIRLTTQLPPKIPITYNVDNKSYFTNDGRLTLTTTGGNTTILLQENSSWSDHLNTSVIFNITRNINLSGEISITNWNTTYIEVNSYLTLPKISEESSNTYIFIKIPSDWINPNIRNNSVLIKRVKSISVINEYLIFDLYNFKINYASTILFEALAKNYFTIIDHPNDISYNEILKIRGVLEHPLENDINLIIRSNNFTLSKQTVVFVNSSFSFPDIRISEIFPIGVLNISIIWSNSLEFGLYQSNIIVHEITTNDNSIKIYTGDSLSIYRFEPIVLDIGLFKDNLPFVSNDTLVFLVKENELLPFINTAQNNFSLHISSVSWIPKDHYLEIIAMEDTNNFYAKTSIEISLIDSEFYWNFSEINTHLGYDQNITFELFCYSLPNESGIYFPIEGVKIEIWLDNTLKKAYNSNKHGLVEVNFFPNVSSNLNQSNMIISALANDKLLRINSLEFFFNNASQVPGFTKVNLHELSKSPITPNSSFYRYYKVVYPAQSSKWYGSIEFDTNKIISAYIIRNNYIIPVEIINNEIRWTIVSNVSITTDILVVELPSPTIYLDTDVLPSNFAIEIEILSSITITNFSLQVDLGFLKLPIKNVSLFDSLNRDITRFYSISVEENKVNITGMTLVEDISIKLLLRGLLTDFNIEIKVPFNRYYEYNESICGSWIVTPFIYSNYSVIYTIEDTDFIVKNTTNYTLENGSTIITATLPTQNWNSKIGIKLHFFISSHFKKTSSLQEIEITDSYAPEVTVSVNSFESDFVFDIYSFESKHASGLKNASLLQDLTVLKSTNDVTFHTRFIISSYSIKKGSLQLVVFDNAGNNHTSIIELKYLNPQPKFVESKIITPIIYSMIFSGLIITIKYYKKQKSAIL